MKKIASILLVSISTIYGMDNVPPLLSDSNQHPKQTQKITFEEIKKQFMDYKEKPNLKPKIIFALTQLMAKGALNIKDKEEAESIARELGAENLALRLQQYGEMKDYGNFNVLPEEIIKLIVHSVANGATAKEIKNLLLVNKSFKAAMLDAPVSFDFSIPPKSGHKYDPIMEEDTGSDYEENNSINDHVIQLLVQIFPNIQRLNLRNTQITDVGLSYLKEAKNLQSLNIQGCEQHLPHKTIGVTSEGLKYLPHFTNLRWLNLSGMPITDETLENLSSLKNLETLIFRGGHITSKRFDHLLKLKNHLRRLSLAFCDGYTNEELLKFLQSMDLIALDLTSTKINDEAVGQLNKKIKFLNLDQTPITAKSIDALRNLEDLTFLRLGYQFKDAHRIQEEDLKELVLKFPHLNITWDGGSIGAGQPA
jgi:hypothetical protein